MPITCQIGSCPGDGCRGRLTMLEVHRYVVTTDIRSHGDNGRGVELSDEGASGNTI